MPFLSSRPVRLKTAGELNIKCLNLIMARQMQENFRVKGKKLYFGFVDLEKAFDRVPRSEKLGNA